MMKNMMFFSAACDCSLGQDNTTDNRVNAIVSFPKIFKVKIPIEGRSGYRVLGFNLL